MAIVLKSLSISLGLFFILAGCLKLSGYISKELHKEVRAEFVTYSKVFPLSKTLEFKVHSTIYRKTVGYLELIFGLALAIIPNLFFQYPPISPKSVLMLTFEELQACMAISFYFNQYYVKNGANMVLLLLTLLAIYSHLMVNAKLERSAPSYVFLFLLCGRLVVYYQLTRSTENTQEPTSNGCKLE